MTIGTATNSKFSILNSDLLVSTPPEKFTDGDINKWIPCQARNDGKEIATSFALATTSKQVRYDINKKYLFHN